jgi:hypothetical protein
MKPWFMLSLSLLAACQDLAPEADPTGSDRVQLGNVQQRLAGLEAKITSLQQELDKSNRALESYRNETDLQFLRTQAELDVLGDAACDLDEVATNPSAAYRGSLRMVHADYCGDGTTKPEMNSAGYAGDFSLAGMTDQEAKDLWTDWVASGSTGSFNLDKDTVTYRGALVVDTKLGATLGKLLATRDITVDGSITFDGTITSTHTFLTVTGGNIEFSDSAVVNFTGSSLEVSGGDMVFSGKSKVHFAETSGTIYSGNLFVMDNASLTFIDSAMDVVGGDVWFTNTSAVEMSKSSLTVTGGNLELRDQSSFTAIDSDLMASSPYSPVSGTISLSGSSLDVSGGDLTFSDSATLLLQRGSELSVTGGSAQFRPLASLWIEPLSGIVGKEALADARDGYLTFDGVAWTMPTLVDGVAADFIDGQVVYLRLGQTPGSDDYEGLNADLRELVAMEIACDVAREKDPNAVCADTTEVEARFAIFAVVLGLNNTKKEPPAVLVP